ncbi:MAG: T9SS type A sorting domain-containing protein [Ignavibacteria bacterium]|nr:T9SS type A sorting domain-containing protein [Ignavibacteria bacterium]
MKKFLLLFVLIISGVYLSELNAQSFQTGSIGVEVNNYGRIRVHAPAIGNLRQIDRSSILVAVSPTQVYDYRKDADVQVASHSIPNPSKSDYEVFVATNNAYSNLPPNVLVRISVYGWQNQPFLIAKFTVVNREANPLQPYIGIEFIPQPDGTYGLETVSYADFGGFGYSFRGTSPLVGYKILSRTTHSFRVIDWTSTYYDPDSLLWSYMTPVRFDTGFVATGDGSVAFLTQTPVAIAPNDSVHFYVGIAVGNNLSTLGANMKLANARYQTLVSVDDKLNPYSFELEQNYPNPFNPSTVIGFTIPSKEKVELSVYNLLGQKIKTLINKELEAGYHYVEFDASDLSGGVYLYKIKAGNYSATKKMIFIK